MGTKANLFLLRKHKKRHRRPYGCTFPKCYQEFGSKYDWERHEAKQHLVALSLLRARQLAEPGLSPGLTGFGRFYGHPNAGARHGRSGSDGLAEYQHCHFEANLLVAFWCGFCRVTVRVQPNDPGDWSARFKHINQHFNDKKESKRIDEWFCIEENGLKGARRGERGGLIKRLQTNVRKGPPSPVPPRNPAPRQSEPSRPEGTPWSTASSPTPTPSNPHGVERAPSPPDVATPVWFCCACVQGPYGQEVCTMCISCGHELCLHCHQETQGVPTEDFIL